MKSVYVGMLAAALVVSAGCNMGSTSGGPGATGSDKGSATNVGQAENSFKLSTPTLATHLKQGEQKVVAISIKRGKNFDQDVALKFEDVPKGVSIDPSSATIKHGEDEAKITVKAADDAAVGDFTVKVVGHPKEGPDATNELKLSIAKK